jgi:hypothetical protein
MPLKLVTPARATVDGAVLSGDATVTGIDTSGLVGAVAVTGIGIPPGTFVESIDGPMSVTLTKAATASGSAVLLTFTLEPITLAEARLHLRQTDTAEDTLIVRLISAARRMCERETWRAFLHSTWDYTLDQWPGWSEWRSGAWSGVGPGHWGFRNKGLDVHIPNPPLVSVSSVSYVDGAGSTTTLASSGYLVTAGTPGSISPAYGTRWPFGRSQPGAITIRYVAGYGPTADAVPDDAKVAILMLVAHMYDNRGDADAAMPGVVKDLLAGVDWGGV